MTRKVLTHYVTCAIIISYQESSMNEKGGSKMDDLIEKIKKAEKVIMALTQLALEIGTFLAVVKMIVESLL